MFFFFVFLYCNIPTITGKQSIPFFPDQEASQIPNSAYTYQYNYSIIFPISFQDNFLVFLVFV